MAGKKCRENHLYQPLVLGEEEQEVEFRSISPALERRFKDHLSPVRIDSSNSPNLYLKFCSQGRIR